MLQTRYLHLPLCYSYVYLKCFHSYRLDVLAFAAKNNHRSHMVTRCIIQSPQEQGLVLSI